ncbi:MAG TPA: lytic transglycosylase domain-containing protein [Thermoanaerobaculia bacterium]|nr:lytic transglycosylase domain-containing protein [Thermoanaerobaculia bacterium]
MIAPLVLTLVLAVGDPRPELVQLQLEKRHGEALRRLDRAGVEEAELAHRLGLDYLRGTLLELLGRRQDAMDAFAAAMAETPLLLSYSRYRLALAQERAGHPEVAAGLVAATVAADPNSPLLPDAVRLLSLALAQGGDCRLLGRLLPERMPPRQRREILLAQADCAKRGGQRELARGMLVELLKDDRRDEVARQTAFRLARMVPETERGEVPRLLGLAFEQHREFERALLQLKRVLPADSKEAPDYEVSYAIARSHFWQGRYSTSGVLFRDLAKRTASPEDKATALYQEARSFELLGHWKTASAAFRQAYLANPGGAWAAPSLLSALRLDWRAGDERSALVLYDQLCARLPWRETAARASLFLSASDVVRHRSDRARPWLERAATAGSRDDQVEVFYWRGRLAELTGEARGAVAAYLGALRADLYHPLSRSALARLGNIGLLRTAAAEGRRFAASSRVDDLVAAWILLGEDNPVGALARRKLRQALLAEHSSGPFLRLAEVPVDRWPLWQAQLNRPEEVLLGLGLWHEGAPALREHFPLADPALAFTAALELSRAGETKLAMDLAEDLRIRTPDRLPLALQPEVYAKLLYPLSYRDLITTQAKKRGISPFLLAAVLREESRFDPGALSTASARGLAQFELPTAQHLAGASGEKSPTSEDLLRPEVAISLGAAYLAELLQALGGSPPLAAAAYNSGKPQVQLWRSYCYSAEPEEFFTKIGFLETRTYVRRVLTSWSQYARIYS